MSNLKEVVSRNKAVAAASLAASASMAMPIVAHASSALPADVTTAITGGFTQLQSVATEVVVLAVGAGVAVIVVSGGAKYALKQIKGLLSKAS